LATSKERKGELVGQYVELLQKSQGVILADYRGLTVARTEALRQVMRDNDAALRVIKNRLFKLALAQAGQTIPAELLDGPSVVAFCLGDVQPVAKALGDFAKTTGVLVIKGGAMGGATGLSAAQVKTLADLPPREVVLAHVLGTINAPASQIVGCVASSIRQVLNVLKAYADKLEGASPASQAA
jgi:large subunit ribosomal protein L10